MSDLLNAALLQSCEPETPRLLEALIAEAGFEPDVYRAAAPDLAGLGHDEAFAHFLLNGVAERRVFPIELNNAALVALTRVRAANRGYLEELCAALTAAYASGFTIGDPACLARQVDRLIVLRGHGCRPFILVGDSHSHVFRRSPVYGGRWLTPVHLLCSAGSARSLRNPESRSGYGQWLRSVLPVLCGRADHPPLIFQFGQVDIEFVSVFQRVRDERTIVGPDYYEDFCRSTVNAYVEFIRTVVPHTDRVLVFSVFPPALDDAHWAQGYLNGHILGLEGDRDADRMRVGITSLDLPDHLTRTGLHARFNMLLAEACAAMGLRFVDVFEPLMRGELLDRQYAPDECGADHHLDYRATADFAEAVLAEQLGAWDSHLT